MSWTNRLKRVAKATGKGAKYAGQGLYAGAERASAERQRRQSTTYMKEELKKATLRRQIASERKQLTRLKTEAGYYGPKRIKRKKRKGKTRGKPRRVVYY